MRVSSDRSRSRRGGSLLRLSLAVASRDWDEDRPWGPGYIRPTERPKRQSETRLPGDRAKGHVGDQPTPPLLGQLAARRFRQAFAESTRRSKPPVAIAERRLARVAYRPRKMFHPKEMLPRGGHHRVLLDNAHNPGVSLAQSLIPLEIPSISLTPQWCERVTVYLSGIGPRLIQGTYQDRQGECNLVFVSGAVQLVYCPRL